MSSYGFVSQSPSTYVPGIRTETCTIPASETTIFVHSALEKRLLDLLQQLIRENKSLLSSEMDAREWCEKAESILKAEGRL